VVWVLSGAASGAAAELPAFQLSPARRLSATFEHTRLVDALEAIAERAGLRLRLHGDFASPVTVALTDVPLDEAIKRLALGHSVCLLYEDRRPANPAALVEVWVFERRTARPAPGPTNALERSQRFRELTELGRRGDAAAVARLEHLLLNDPDPYIRGQAAARLGSVSQSGSSSALRGALRDGAAAVRLQAIRAIARVERERALPTVGTLALHDQDVSVRREATRLLGTFGGDEARRALEALAAGPDPSVRQEAQRGLARWRSTVR
jgi:hypothetical protein